jgi:probable rRNA maturation factor
VGDPSSPTGIDMPIEVDVVVSDEQAEVAVDAHRWAMLAADVLRSEGRGGELTLTFVDRAEMSVLNEEHMGVAGPTDVLSFPLDDDPTGVDVGPVLLGDIVICPAVAAASAPEHAGSLDDELALLTVHGVLHVLGHDHAEPEEASVMKARELTHLVEHHWHGPAPTGFRQEQVDA